MKTCLTKTRNVGTSLDAALGHFHNSGWHEFSEPERGIEVNLKGMQVAVVHADDLAAGVEGALQFSGIVHLAQHVELPLAGAEVKPRQLTFGERGDDQQDSVRMKCPRFQELEF